VTALHFRATVSILNRGGSLVTAAILNRSCLGKCLFSVVPAS